LVHEQLVVEPQVSHFMQVPLRTRVKLPHSSHISPSWSKARARAIDMSRLRTDSQESGSRYIYWEYVPRKKKPNWTRPVTRSLQLNRKGSGCKLVPLADARARLIDHFGGPPA